MSHSTCWLKRVERRSAGIAWRAGRSQMRYSRQLWTIAGVRSRTASGMLAARRARAISSSVARHHQRHCLRSSRVRVSRGSPRNARGDVAMSKR
eukprot:8375103-Pyramimonas_sp.AAC.1